ncbi:hypothetical protein MTR_5g041190 [Medicago truncatula]|uniref:Reverse transcriptase zinc-binding domain-containing protein n=1 Tax=Medicago truncatula TaxID=3880 RepID=G7KFB9_MEDTR|nr:hypothetical protein MTR_5g041190 [Medicago truncatula]
MELILIFGVIVSVEYVPDGFEGWRGAWQCHRRLWAWEEKLIEECRDLLLTVTLQDDSSDMWLWLPDQSGGYTVCGVYDMLTVQNLANRGIVSMDSRLCLAGCGQVEDVNHLFLSCPVFGALWPLVRDWLGVEGAESQVILNRGVRFFHQIWLLCVWVLWKDQNDKLFRNTHSSLPHMLDKVKSYSLWWLKAGNVAFRFSTQNWWSNPLVCLGIG